MRCLWLRTFQAGAAEGLRKWRGYSVEFTRKFIHITVGMWAYGASLVSPFHLIGGAPHDEGVEEQDIGIVRALLKPT